MSQAIEETWNSFKHKPTLIDLYTEDATVVYVPNSVGVRGKTEIRKFFLHPHFSPKANTVNETVINTLVSNNKLFEESIWSVHFNSGACNWLVPGIEERYLLNATVKFPITASVSFVNNKIQCVRYYWDQACILKQLKVISDDTQWPVIGEHQIDALQLSSGMRLRSLNDSPGLISSPTSSVSNQSPDLKLTKPSRNIFTFEPPTQRPLVAPHPNKLGSGIILGEDPFRSSQTSQNAVHHPGIAGKVTPKISHSIIG